MAEDRYVNATPEDHTSLTNMSLTKNKNEIQESEGEVFMNMSQSCWGLAPSEAHRKHTIHPRALPG